jgi:hypothetical protein
MDARVRAWWSTHYLRLSIYYNCIMRKKKLYLAAAYKLPSIKRSALVYYIRLRFADGLTLYKIGYTSMTITKRVEGYYDYKTKRRTAGMGLPCGCTYRIIDVVYKGRKEEAYRREQALHKMYSTLRYKGPVRVRNGHTELYLTDVLGLDKPV